MTYCPRYIHTMYCDDVRQEIGGKMTFVGAYQNQMIAEQPGTLVLPKLCIVLTVQTPHDQPFKKLKMRLFSGEEVLQESELPVVGRVVADATNGLPANFDVLGVILTLGGMRFEKSTTLRVRVETESEELSAAAFHVILKDEDSSASVEPPLL